MCALCLQSAHIRFSSLGVLSTVVRSTGDVASDYSGVAFGAGVLYFFGESNNKPYVGGILDFETANMLYEEGENWEYTEDESIVIFMFNGGYRFRFSDGFFINLGAFLGAASLKWDAEYTDYYDHPDHGQEWSGKLTQPFGMAEVTLGKEF